MSEKFSELAQSHIDFIQHQHLFFVGSAAKTGRVNVSPKGMDSFRVLDKQRIAWLNYTGSGNETAAHVLDIPRMTIMFCSFEKQPLILRLYGEAKTLHPRDAEWQQHITLFDNVDGARQIYLLDIDLVQTSCGFSVPFMTFESNRETLSNWAAKHEDNALEAYWQKKNTVSIDGLPTGILADEHSVD